MSYDQERQDITSHFETEWALTAYAALPVKYQNRAFDPPDEGPWVEMNILRGQAAAAALVGGGVVRYRHPGVLQFDVILEAAKGTRSALVICDQIAAIFRGVKVSNILFRAPDGPRMLNEPETSRQRFILSIPFQRDENL